ncbi:MAG: zinc-ribbon domain-containing protein, partial [Polyangiaceae bacterium]
MKISCQSCQSKYNVADEKVQGKVVKIRCRKCGATIVVDGNAPGGTNGSAGTAEPAQAGEGGGDGQWHVNVSETDQRSMTLAELVDAYNSSVVTQETYIWTDGMDDWKPLGEVDAVVSALHAAAGGGAAAPPETEQEDQATQAFSYDQAAAGGYGTPFDGGRGVAAAAPEPAPEPRRAAVAKPRG